MKAETKLVDGCRSLDRTVITMDFYELNTMVHIYIPCALGNMKKVFKDEVASGYPTSRSKAEIRQLQKLCASLEKCLDEMMKH